jgi:hypothetical protein
MDVLRRLACWIGWHQIGNVSHFDGVSFHAKCRHCGYVGMVDSNGELF